MGCIYLVTNCINGKRYVGKSVFSMEERRRTHERDSRYETRSYFHRALRKYGYENFEWRLITGGLDESILDEAEMLAIEFLGTEVPDGYNMTGGGDGALHRCQTEQAKSEISRKAKERFSRPGIREKHRATMKRTMGRPEVREKLRIAQTGKKASLQARINMSKIRKGRKGKPHSEETKALLSRINKGKVSGPFSKEHRRKISEALTGRKKASHTEETKAKISKSLTGQKRGPYSVEHCRKISEAKKGKPASPKLLAHLLRLNKSRSKK